MLTSKEVEVTLNYKNKDWYINKGYNYTKQGEKITVKIEDLNSSSQQEIDVECDYCKKKVKKYYSQYLEGRKYVKKDSCGDCVYEKIDEVINKRQSLGLLKKGDNGYWNFKENILSELQEYIITNKTLDKITTTKRGASICCAMYNLNLNLIDLIKELGYDVDNIYKAHRTVKFYESFDNVQEIIQNFIDENNHFPTQNELKNELNINSKILRKYGGIYEIKRMMNYESDTDLIDDNGWYNKSIYEFYVAQFLIHNEISYKREQSIHKNHKYLSDFTLTKLNNEVIHVEVWGFVNNSSPRSERYLKRKEDKLSVYTKYNINCIEINPNVFINKTLKDINEELYKIFKNVLNLQFKEQELEVYIPSSAYSDEELRDKTMKYSKDGITLPTQQMMRDSKNNYIYKEIIRRFGSYFNFANEFNLKTEHRDYNYWNINTIFECFDYMIKNFGKTLNFKEISDYKQDENITGINGGISRNGGLTEIRLNYYEDCLKRNKNLPEHEIDILSKIYQRKPPYNKVTEDQSKKAGEIWGLLRKVS